MPDPSMQRKFEYGMGRQEGKCKGSLSAYTTILRIGVPVGNQEFCGSTYLSHNTTCGLSGGELGYGRHIPRLSTGGSADNRA